MTRTTLDGVGSLQEQVRRTIVADISERQFAPGAQLPTEQQYVDRFGVSLITVRHALASLVQAGYIERASGRGTFVADRVPYEIKLMSSVTDSLRAAEVPFQMQVLLAGATVPPDDVRGLLKLRRDVKAFRLRRLASIRDAPAILLDSWLRRSATAELERDVSALQDSSLYALLAERGIRLAHAEGRVELVYADDDEAALLRLPFGAPLFAYTATAVDEDRRPIERARALYDATRFALTVSPEISAG